MTSRQLSKHATRIGFWVLVALVVVIAVFPFYYAVKTSFTPSSELFHVELWPSRLDFTNYVQIFTQKSFLQAIFNSIVVATSVVFIALLLGITASY
ncbi:hypothetical protein Q427_06470, partial [Halomonas sp. BC04]